MRLPNIKEFGYSLFFVARGPFITTILIIFYPLLFDLAKYNSDMNDLVHLFGFRIKPSVFVVLINSLTSFSIIVLSPVIGAISDYGNYKQKLIRSGIITFAITFSFVFLLYFSQFWWLSAIIQIVGISSFESAYVLMTSYLSEVAENKERRSFLSAASLIGENTAVFVFLIILPVVLRYENPRNLITRGNFNVAESYKSWNLKIGDDVVNCYKENLSDNFSNLCWVNSVSKTKKQLKIFIPEKKSVSLFQRKPISKTITGQFQFSVELKSSNEKESNFNLIIEQRKKENENVIAKKESINFKLSQKLRYYKTKFRVDENTNFLDFIIKFKPGENVLLEINKIETVISIDEVHVLVLFFTAAWFSFNSFISTIILGKRPICQNVPGNENIVKFGILRLKNTILHCYSESNAFRFIFGNIFWGCGYTIFNLLILLFLEDLCAMSSRRLALIFLSTCVSIMFGALLCYKLEKKIKQWNTAMIFYFVWIFNPIFLYLFHTPNFLMNILFSIYFGILMGVILSLRYSIFSNLIPKNHEGEYMGLFYFSTKLMDFTGNIFVIIALSLVEMETVMLISSIFFLVAFLVLLPMMVAERDKERVANYGSIENVRSNDSNDSRGKEIVEDKEII